MIGNDAAEGVVTPPHRILLVEINHDGTFGGSHQAMFDLARHLDPKRYTPVVLFYEDNPFAEELRRSGFRVLTWGAEWLREHGTRARWFSPRRIVKLGAAVARRVSLLRRERIDLVHINNSPSFSYFDWLPAARLLGIPCVTHLRGELYPISGRFVRWLNYRFDHYITISSYVSGILKNEHFPSDRISQIEDGLDIDAFLKRVTRSRDEVRAELGAAPGQILAVMVGHLREWKGQDIVLRALGELERDEKSGIRVVFVGADDPVDTAFRTRLNALVREYRLESCVQFLGGRHDVPDLMNGADLVLHASTRPEPFGLVVLEGMVLGRLVIAAALGGPLQIVGEGSGWTFDPTQPSALAALLRRVIGHPELSTSFSETATSRAATFTVQRTTTRVQNVYAGLLGGNAVSFGI
jgi:glycosyltransferase involved in cell wall biosynthesis